jgi:peptidoglycan/xylan/chitin deacetylase (PgdA/CDA1 family)
VLGLLELLERLALRPCILVLGYHRISDVGENSLYHPIDSASPAVFEAQVRFLRDRFHLPASETWPDLLAGRVALQEPTAILTFDDGYRDNFDRALPILEALGVPAGFFLATDFLESPRLFWWDHVASVVKQTHVPRLVLDAPEPLDLDLHRTERSQVLARVIAAFWRAERPDDPSVLEHLAQRAEVAIDATALAAGLFLTWDEVRALAAAGMGIGSHTHTHRSLGHLPEEDQRRELAESRQILERHLGRAVTTLAYPYGGAGDISDQTKRLAREAGYEVAFALRRGVARTGRWDPLDVPRVAVAASESFSLFRARADLLAAFGGSIV